MKFRFRHMHIGELLAVFDYKYMICESGILFRRDHTESINMDDFIMENAGSGIVVCEDEVVFFDYKPNEWWLNQTGYRYDVIKIEEEV